MSAHVAGAAGPARRPSSRAIGAAVPSQPAAPRPAAPGAATSAAGDDAAAASSAALPHQAAAPHATTAPHHTWYDLAANRPGVGAEERARAARRAAPIRSTLGRVLPVTTQERTWRLAAAGQRKVGVTLSRLGPEWRVLHSVPVGQEHDHIDHLLIGPPGLLTLTSKYHRGGLVQVFGDSVRVDGNLEPYVSEARYEAWRAACLLTAACGYRILVAPAVVIVGAEDVRVARPAQGVEILDRRYLLRWLACQPHRLRPVHVDHIFAAARRSDTWLRRPATLHQGQAG